MTDAAGIKRALEALEKLERESNGHMAHIDVILTVLEATNPVPAPGPRYEYYVRQGPRKAWDGTPEPEGEGWVEVSWERFDYHEERIWRREVTQ